MKKISKEMLDALESNNLIFPYCYKIILANSNKNLYLTSHTSAFEFDGNIYYPVKCPFDNEISKNQEKLVFEFCNHDESESLNISDVLSSGLNNALFEYFMVNIFSDTQERLMLKSGIIEYIEIIGQNKFSLKITSLLNGLSNEACIKFSQNCRACFGDKKCGLDLSKYKYSGTITRIINDKSFIDTACDQKIGYFSDGFVKIDGYRYKVKFYINNIFELYNKPLNPLSVNDKFEAFPTCNKTIKMCGERYDNLINFRGEP